MPKPNKGGGGNGVISGNKRDNVLIGTNNDEILNGKGGNDRLIGAGGDDTIYGGAGSDTAVFSFSRDDYDVTLLEDGRIQVTGPEGTDTIDGVEFFEFADMTQSAAEVTLPRLPNLSADELVVEDAVLSPGEATNVTVSIASNGVVDSEGSTAELLIATAPDAASIVGTVDTVSLAEIATGSADTAVFSVDSATLGPGTYWVAVRVDSGDVLTEENEADNLTEWVQVTVEPPVADLQLVSADLGDGTDLDLEGGGKIEIDYTIHDASNMDVSYFKVVTYLSTDGTISADDLSIAGATGGTYPGLTTSFTTGYWLPEDYAPGDYYLISVVDWGNGAEDTSPENNTLVQTVTLTPPPAPTVDVAVNTVTVESSSDLDLGPSGIYTPAGAQIDLAINLSNYGTGAATDTGLTAYLSTDATLSADDIAIWTGTADVIAGGSATISATASVGGDVLAGDYQVILVADTAADTDISNNSSTASVSLIGGLALGTDQDDIWISGPGGDIVDLLGGDDIAIGGPGFDKVDGGAGLDTLDFSSHSEAVSVFYDDISTNSLIENGQLSGEFEAEYFNFESLILTDQDDYADLSGSTIQNVEAGAGNDFVIGSYGDDVINGGSGDDLLSGHTGNDVLITGEGNDMIGVKLDVSGGGSTGFGHDTVDDFDFNFDTVVIEVGVGETYDPMADLVQTEEGSLLVYADDSSLLLKDVDVADLDISDFLIIEEQTVPAVDIL